MFKEVRSSYRKLQNDIESMCQWLESLDIGIEQNRVADYRKTFVMIAEHTENGTLSELQKSIDFAKQAEIFTMRASWL